ncbi:tRNA lysidine(34) synthetase TilS [Catalinimonas niigatensis]|uniref:tRNA lysidine(34) synthetase TilS n=1 Tax=Catalinimonas niigatensis TaxID=1397264 RepID=UPI0026650DBA|nr:tRNA lysidine(34) synthetase TilS [Catalinimonas niigatensis]WPP52473.1 tRNA lysidine(34) synthetase TilS [Catalinimonas niigatensis]
MVNKFRSFIHETNLFVEKTPILLAVSGGIDSVVMADLFARANFRFAIVHCNFNLRGEESDDDEVFVKQLAQKYQVSCFVKSFDTSGFADLQHISIQMAARQLRYTWFNDLLKEQNYEYIATAHHKNDVLETIIFNLTKGTGIAGLHGIKLKQSQIIRPLLFADRKQIEQYAQEHQLPWREDSSNVDEKYRRNLIRRKVIPVLEEINPKLMETMDMSLERISGTENFFQYAVHELKKKCMYTLGKDVFININKIKNQPGLYVVLHEMIKEYGFQYHQAREIVEAIRRKNPERQSGKVFNSSSHCLNIDRKELIISLISSDPMGTYTITEKEHKLDTDEFDLSLQVLDAHNYRVMPLANIAALDHERLKFPLTLRKWKKGDFFYPLGMNSKKKLSDFMIDIKIPLNLKNRVMVLTSDGDIVWVVGYRIDHRYRLTDNTHQIYEITQHVKSLP